MEYVTIELRRITASHGMVLTNGESYGKTVYLGKNDLAENWREITEAQYAEILAEQERKNMEVGEPR